MFTGIIEELGSVRTITKNKLNLDCSKVLENTGIGDSIAVNGVCLTVCSIDNKGFSADVSEETFKVTNFGRLKCGDLVNLERAMAVNGRFGGHLVSGHIDNTAKVTGINSCNDFYILNIELKPEQLKYTIKKGSIAVNGISLTIADINGSNIEIAVIPHTYKNTNLKTLQQGDFVNIEVDITAKYIEKFLSTDNIKTGIDSEFLHENGFL